MGTKQGDRSCCHLKMSDVDNHFFGRLLLPYKVAIPICPFPVSVRAKTCSINQDICQKWWSFLLSLLSSLICSSTLFVLALSQLHPKAG